MTGDADSSAEDAAAIMNGYWNAYLGATLKKRYLGCGIYIFYYINISPCDEVCDVLYDIFPLLPGIIITEPLDLLLSSTFVDSVNSIINDNKEIVIKTAAKEVSKTDEEKANQISEDRIITSQPTEESINVTEELKSVNNESYEQRAKDLKENGEKGVRIVKFLLNKHKKEIHDLRNISPLCNIDQITDDHKLYVRNEKLALRTMSQGYDGCKHCMEKFHFK